MLQPSAIDKAIAAKRSADLRAEIVASLPRRVVKNATATIDALANLAVSCETVVTGGEALLNQNSAVIFLYAAANMDRALAVLGAQRLNGSAVETIAAETVSLADHILRFILPAGHA